jgi:SAM-dependent methyltransferase
MALNQEQQDRIWDHHQTQGTGVFDLSYPRLRYLAERCAPGSRVLNVGVGAGYLERLLLARGVHVYSLDPSRQSIERLRVELGMADRARHGYGQQMPFDDGNFDTVIATEVLEHLTGDVLEPTVAEVHRVLRPGGHFIGTVPYREDMAANTVMCPHCEAHFHRWGHEQRFDTAGLRALLERHRFDVREVYPRTFADFRRRSPRLFVKAVFRHVLGRLGEPLVGPNLYFRARRSAP